MKLILHLLFCFLLIQSIIPESTFIFAQDSTSSLAFKRNRLPAPYPVFYAPDLSYKLKQQFQLIKMANSGDPLAQHELGLRYLQGVDMPPDTIKAAEWIRKAAELELPSACYNYAILLLNGWGVPWNPFKAFQYFKTAADDGMPQAQYITGILFTENLIVKKDRKAALEWLNKSAAKDYEPALEVIKEITAGKGKDTTASDKSFTVNNSPLVFIDFEFDSSSMKEISEHDLINFLPLSGNEELISSITGPDSVLNIDSLDYKLLEEASDAGCPEALTLTGYLYEKGKHFQKDVIRAGNYYFRAAKLDSRNALYLLWKLSNEFELYKQLEPRVKEKEPEAMFLLYGLKSLNLTDLISDEKASELLLESAYVLPYANVESAVNIYTGRYDHIESFKGVEILKIEMAEGNLLAEQRYISIRIIDSSRVSPDEIRTLFAASEKGSILAETLLGLCYKDGLAVSREYGTAVRYFRRAAQRGSNFAFEQLKQMHDSLRPVDDIFSIN